MEQSENLEKNQLIEDYSLGISTLSTYSTHFMEIKMLFDHGKCPKLYFKLKVQKVQIDGWFYSHGILITHCIKMAPLYYKMRAPLTHSGLDIFGTIGFLSWASGCGTSSLWINNKVVFLISLLGNIVLVFYC